MTRVPNVFHFVFGFQPQTEPFHLMHYICLASCIGVNRPDAVFFHCQHEPWGEYWERIRPALQIRHIEPDSFIASFRYKDPAIERLRYAHITDVARLKIIEEHGGIYADMDTLFVSPVPAPFFERSFVMGKEKTDLGDAASREAGGSLCNAWMMGEPGAPFAREWLARLKETFDGTWNAHSCLAPYRLSREHPDWIHVEPERSFFYFDYNAPGLCDIFMRRVADLAGIYSIHLWSHRWWNANLRGPITFHAGRLTPAYIRHADTTYAEVARNFLPPDLGRQGVQKWAGERLRNAWEDALWRVIGPPGRLDRRLRRRRNRRAKRFARMTEAQGQS
ncbi:MAG TPA: glycosyltransferase [Alphaproteobacteria bacterium]|nr:glycosyltransferase [Alphaproteobacteria bacterium]